MISSWKIILVFLLAATASAQHWVGVRAGMINYAEGIFFMDREPLRFPEARFREIPPGKSLRTGDGWVEVQLGPNAFLWLGENSALRIEDPSLTDTQVRIERGSAVFQVLEQTKENKLRIRFGEAVIVPRQAGLYRLDGAKSQICVFTGKAEVLLAGKKAKVQQGKAAALTAGLKTSKFDMQKTDRLQEMAARRSQILNAAILAGLGNNAPMVSEGSTGQQQGKPEWQKRLETEQLYQGNLNDQPRPAAAGPHAQPWEPSQIIYQNEHSTQPTQPPQ